MKLFVSVNGADCRGRTGIDGPKLRDLQFQMAEDHAFDGDSGGSDGLPPAQACHHSQNKAAKCAQIIAATAALAATCKLSLEDRSMATFVLPEVTQDRNEIASRQAGGQDLSGVDADRTVLPGVIDLDDPRA